METIKKELLGYNERVWADLEKDTAGFVEINGRNESLRLLLDSMLASQKECGWRALADEHSLQNSDNFFGSLA